MGVNTSDIARDACMLKGDFAKCGYDWWWHSFTAHDAETGIAKPFFVEFFLCNPVLAGDEPTFGLAPDGSRPAAAGTRPAVAGTRPSSDGSRPAEKGTIPADCGQRPAADGSRPATDAQRPSYLMVKVGTWGPDARQLHRFFAWKDVEVGWGVPFYVQADDCLCCETDLIGRVEVSAEDAAAHPEWMSDAGSMVFDLHLDKRVAYNVGYGAGDAFRELRAFDMFWHAEGMKTLVSGTVVLDGRRYVVTPEDSYGYSDKNWGRDFTTPWVWLSGWDLVSNITGERLSDSAFEIGGGRPVAFGVALDRKLLGCAYYEGTGYEFNFSKVWTGSTTRFSCYETPECVLWHVDQETLTHRMITDIRANKCDMLLMNYESPDGCKRFNRLWNGGNGTGRVQLYEKRDGAWELIDDMCANHVGCEYGEYDA